MPPAAMQLDGRLGKSRTRRRQGLAIVASLAVLPWAQEARAINLNDPAAAAAGGIANYWDSANTQPNVVSLFDLGAPTSQCTGSLINSRTILTAAHCLVPDNTTSISPQRAAYEIRFNPDAKAPSIHDSAQSGALVHFGYNSSVMGVNDIALLSLAKPVTGVQSVTPIKPGDPLPAVGTLVTMSGYGLAGTGTAPNTVDDSRRRIGQNNIAGFEPTPPGSVAPVAFTAVFRDPDDFPPGTLPPLEAEPAGGDSGGPLFIVTEKGLVQIGTVIGGTDGYGSTNAWTAVIYYSGWIAENDPLRITAARAGTFSWSQSEAWVDALGRSEVPNNSNGNFNGFGTLGRYYNVTIAAPTIMSLDMNPTIDTLSIAGAQSQLVVGAPYTLNVLLGTALSAGTLTMGGGTLVSPELLISGGLLTGNGTIAAAGGTTGLCNSGMCVSGGAVAPVGTLTIQGNYTQTGGLLQFQVAPDGANGRLAVANTATLGGALGVTVTPGVYGPSTPYTLLTASTVSGQFAQFISTSPSAFLKLSDPIYTPTSVNVTLTRIPFGGLPGLADDALEQACSPTLAGAAARFCATLLMAGSEDLLQQLFGDGTTAAQHAAFASNTMFDAVLMDQGAFWRSGETADGNGVALGAAPLGYAAEKPAPSAFKALRAPGYQPRTWRGWVSGFGGVGSFAGDAAVGSADARTATAGGAMGFDYQIDPTRLIGFAVGASDSHFSVSERATSGDVLGGHLGAYGVATWGAVYAAGLVSYGRFDSRSARTIVGLGPTEIATGRFASDLFGARLEIGRTHALPGFNITPFAALQTATLWQRGFTETSTAGGLPGIFGLAYQPQTVTSLPAFLGLQFDTRLSLSNGTVWSPFARVAWVHEFRPDRSTTSSFVSLPGTLFAVDGARAWSDALKVNAGSRVALNRYASLFASFDGEFSNSGHSYGGRGGLRFSW
jgi:subtilase-type serine protease